MRESLVWQALLRHFVSGSRLPAWAKHHGPKAPVPPGVATRGRRLSPDAFTPPTNTDSCVEPIGHDENKDADGVNVLELDSKGMPGCCGDDDDVDSEFADVDWSDADIVCLKRAMPLAKETERDRRTVRDGETRERLMPNILQLESAGRQAEAKAVQDQARAREKERLPKKNRKTKTRPRVQGIEPTLQILYKDEPAAKSTQGSESTAEERDEELWRSIYGDVCDQMMDDLTTKFCNKDNVESMLRSYLEEFFPTVIQQHGAFFHLMWEAQSYIDMSDEQLTAAQLWEIVAADFIHHPDLVFQGGSP